MGRGKLISREMVLDKAVELASQHGIATVTYNGLARELDIRPQSMYRYVTDLKELRIWLLHHFLEELVGKIDAAMANLPPAEALRIFAITMYDACHTNPRYYETFELMNSDAVYEELRQPLIDLANLVQVPMEQLEGQTEDASRHTQLFVAVNLGYAKMSMTHFIPTSLQDDREMFVRSIDEFIAKFLSPSIE